MCWKAARGAGERRMDEQHAKLPSEAQGLRS